MLLRRVNGAELFQDHAGTGPAVGPARIAYAARIELVAFQARLSLSLLRVPLGEGTANEIFGC
jgi:hypothetical protein